MNDRKANDGQWEPILFTELFNAHTDRNDRCFAYYKEHVSYYCYTLFLFVRVR